MDELLADGAVRDATGPALAEHLDTWQLADHVFTVGAYESAAFLPRSFGVDLDDDLRPT